MSDIATSIYIACTDFILALSHMFGISYRDANALLFFVAWPALTVALAAVVLIQAVKLAMAKHKAHRSS